MELTLDIIESYGFPKKTHKPDWDDVEITYTLPNGIELSTMTMCNLQPCSPNSLEGVDGFIDITTKEELDELLSKTDEAIYREIAASEKDFDLDRYI